MNDQITVMSSILNPINDYLKSFTKKKDKNFFKTLLFFLLLGFTGIPIIKFGELKKGGVIFLCLILGAGSNFFFDIMILRQVLCLIWMFNYIAAFWELLQTSNKKWFFKIIVIVLSFIPTELAVVYLFQLA